MHSKIGGIFVLMLWAWVWTVGADGSVQTADAGNTAAGVLEVDSNIAHVRLRLCPKDQYLPKETKVFFGLITSVKHVCSGNEILVGETPLRPTLVPAGTYILMIPSDYVWEGEGPVELTILPNQKTYFLLKLFDTRTNPPESNHGGAGGGGAGSR